MPSVNGDIIIYLQLVEFLTFFLQQDLRIYIKIKHKSFKVEIKFTFKQTQQDIRQTEII